MAGPTPYSATHANHSQILPPTCPENPTQSSCAQSHTLPTHSPHPQPLLPRPCPTHHLNPAPPLPPGLHPSVGHLFRHILLGVLAYSTATQIIYCAALLAPNQDMAFVGAIGWTAINLLLGNYPLTIGQTWGGRVIVAVMGPCNRGWYGGARKGMGSGSGHVLMKCGVVQCVRAWRGTVCGLCRYWGCWL